MTIRYLFITDRLKGRSMQINKDSASIGRGPDNDLRIDDPSVSKRHAMIFKTPKGYSIEDLKESEWNMDRWEPDSKWQEDRDRERDSNFDW